MRILAIVDTPPKKYFIIKINIFTKYNLHTPIKLFKAIE